MVHFSMTCQFQITIRLNGFQIKPSNKSAYLAQSGGILQTTVSTVKFQILGQFDRWWAEGMLQLWQTWAGGQIAGENKHCSTAVKLPRNMAPDGTLAVE